jgi:hypothetical protein
MELLVALECRFTTVHVAFAEAGQHESKLATNRQLDTNGTAKDFQCPM